MPSITQKKPVFETPWFSLIEKKVDEEEAPYYALDLPEYCSVLALTADQEVVLVRQFRPAVEGETVELPAGTVDAGEKPAESMARELVEETGYRADELQFLGALVPDTGRLGNRMHCFFAAGVQPVEGAEVEEGLSVDLCSIEALVGMIGDGVFNHALHLATLQLAVLQGKVTLPSYA